MSWLKRQQSRLADLLPAHSLRARFAAGAFWSGLGTAFFYGFSFLSQVVAARILGSFGFGELSMVHSTVAMFGVFAGFGLGLTATKHVAEFRTTDPARAGRILGLSYAAAAVTGTVVAGLLVLTAPHLARSVLNAPHLAGLLRLGAGILLFNTFSGAQTGALIGFEAFRTLSRVNLVRGVSTFAAVATGVLAAGLGGAVAGMLVGSAADCAINHVALTRTARAHGVALSLRHARRESAILWKFALPAFLSNIVVTPALWGARALLANQPEGYVEVGLFSAAARVQAMLTLMGTTVGAALLPMLSSEEGSGSDRLARANILVSWAFGILAVLPLVCLPETLGILFGPEFSGEAARKMFILMMCATSILLYKQGLARVLAARNLMWWSLLSNGLWALTLFLVLVPVLPLGAFGLASALVTAYAVNAVFMVGVYYRLRLVPRRTLVSPQAALIWIALVVLSWLSYAGTAPGLRLVVGFCALPLVVTLLRQMLQEGRSGGSPRETPAQSALP